MTRYKPRKAFLQALKRQKKRLSTATNQTNHAIAIPSSLPTKPNTFHKLSGFKWGANKVMIKYSSVGELPLSHPLFSGISYDDKVPGTFKTFGDLRFDDRLLIFFKRVAILLPRRFPKWGAV